MWVDSRDPLYYRVANHLRNRIMGGIYKSGEKIPSESELCNEFSVSRITIRQALKLLEDQGMLIRKQGVGTLVNVEINCQPISFSGYIEDIIFQVLPAKVINFKKEEVEPQTEIKNILKLKDNEKVIKLERIRSIDNKINCYALNYIPIDIGDCISENNLNEYTLIELIDMKSVVKEANQTITAIKADDVIADKLKIQKGDPVLFSEYVMYDKDNRPLNLARVHYHPERYNFTVKMGRLRNDFS
jgi:GntR family transcriptional regulator